MGNKKQDVQVIFDVENMYVSETARGELVNGARCFYNWPISFFRFARTVFKLLLRTMQLLILK